MPGHRHAGAGRLAENLATPENDVRSERLLDQVQEPRQGAELEPAFVNAARNIPLVDVLPQQGINVYDILRRDVLVLSKDAATHLEERLK